MAGLLPDIGSAANDLGLGASLKDMTAEKIEEARKKRALQAQMDNRTGITSPPGSAAFLSLTGNQF